MNTFRNLNVRYLVEKMRIVVDSSVLVDIFHKESVRHKEAIQLLNCIQTKNIEILVPLHAIIEVSAAIKRQRIDGPTSLFEGLTEHNPLRITTFPIDNTFLNTYFSPTLPYLKSGDLIFLALANGEKVPLITEDKKLIEKSKEIGVEVYRISDFIQNFC